MAKVDKLEKLALLDAAMEKKYGKEFIIDLEKPIELERVKTGIIGLDAVLGGGVPVGRIMQIYGESSTGKTTVATEIVCAFQKYFKDKLVAYFDAENVYDFRYAEAIGLDRSREKFRFCQDSGLEDVTDAIIDYAESGMVSMIVLDSLDCLSLKQTLEGSMEDNEQGLSQKKYKQFYKKVIAALNKNNCTLLIISQTFGKPVKFGSPNEAGGGKSTKFFSSVRLEISRVETLEKNGVITGIVSKVYSVKNKTAPPFCSGEFTIMFGTGVDRVKALVDECVHLSIIKKNQAWFEFDGQKFQGQDKLIAAVKEDEKFYKKLSSMYEKERQSNG